MARLAHLILRNGAIGLALIACLACGGDGGSDSTDVAGGGISGTGISSGPITDFGSIVVNDVHFDVSTATILVNGGAATEDDLRLGQVVTVAFTGDTATGRATANSVTYARDLAGPVEEIDFANRQVRVLGQWVPTDRLLAASDEGQPDELHLEDFASDDTVEISGQFDADGVLHATRIERKGHSGPQEVEVKGAIQNLTQNTFTIRDLTVDYRHAMMMPHMLTEGFLVEVKGTVDNTGTVIATEVTVKDNPSPVAGSPAGTEVEIDGFITEFHRFASHGELTVDQQRVRKTESTKFKGGATADGAGLGLNVRVEVEGIVGDDGVVIATVIELDD